MDEEDVASSEIARSTVEEGLLPATEVPVRVERVGVGQYKVAMLDTNLLAMKDVYVEVGTASVEVGGLVLTREGVTPAPDKE